MKQQLLTVLLLAISVLAYANEPIENGKALYTSRCGNCHKINEVFVGPALADVGKRHNIDWIVKFVQSSQTMVKSGDEKAVALFAKYKIPMPDQKDLTPKDIDDILGYIDNEAKVNSGVVKPPLAKPTQTQLAYLATSFSENRGFLVAILASIALLIGTLLFYARVKKYERTKVW